MDIPDPVRKWLKANPALWCVLFGALLGWGAASLFYVGRMEATEKLAQAAAMEVTPSLVMISTNVVMNVATQNLVRLPDFDTLARQAEFRECHWQAYQFQFHGSLNDGRWHPNQFEFEALFEKPTHFTDEDGVRYLQFDCDVQLYLEGHRIGNSRYPVDARVLVWAATQKRPY